MLGLPYEGILTGLVGLFSLLALTILWLFSLITSGKNPLRLFRNSILYVYAPFGLTACFFGYAWWVEYARVIGNAKKYDYEFFAMLVYVLSLVGLFIFLRFKLKILKRKWTMSLTVLSTFLFLGYLFMLAISFAS